MKYDLDKLGCVDFEGLCQTLLKARLGVGVEAWGGSGDWGCDSYFADSLHYPSVSREAGPFIFQAKFVIAANAAGAKPETALLAAINRECERIAARLRPQGNAKHPKWRVEPKHYALLTNVTVAPALRTKITTKVHGVLPTSQIHVHGATDICAWLSLQPDIIPAFPQLLTVADWSELIRLAVHSGIYARSEVALSLAEQAAKVFVPTAAYFAAQEKLRQHHFVVLEGPPEMGKTTIGRMIAIAQATQKWEAIECRTPVELLKVFAPERAQVFIADDFFGRGEYEPTRMSQWEGELPYILDRLNHKHWLILTSRAHILNIAKRHLDVSGQNHRFPHISEVLVNAGDLNLIEKGKILYRHARAADLSRPICRYIREEAEVIASNPHFTPLRIKNFVHSLKSITTIVNED